MPHDHWKESVKCGCVVDPLPIGGRIPAFLWYLVRSSTIYISCPSTLESQATLSDSYAQYPELTGDNMPCLLCCSFPLSGHCQDVHYSELLIEYRRTVLAQATLVKHHCPLIEANRVR